MELLYVLSAMVVLVREAEEAFFSDFINHEKLNIEYLLVDESRCFSLWYY